MSEFRFPTHNKRYPKRSANRFAFMVVLVVGVIVMVMYGLKKAATFDKSSPPVESPIYFPEPLQGVVYTKPGFSLSYVEKYELPEWVSYELTVDMMNKPRHERDQEFNPDPHIRTGSAHYRDYKASGYRRGHLVPSADMAWNKSSMDATFLLSNVAPMRQEFNDGIWLELEHNVRDWSRHYKRIQVVAGPVWDQPVTTIGQNDVLVPRYFFKAVFTVHQKEPRVIGFLFDQTAGTFQALPEYVVPIDSLEKITGIDLFSNLYGSWDAEISLEKSSGYSATAWPFNPRWYAQRVR